MANEVGEQQAGEEQQEPKGEMIHGPDTFGAVDLRALAEREGPERAFLSLYLSSEESLGELESRIETARRVLGDNEVEQEYFEENLRMAQAFLEGEDRIEPGGGLCMFVCWATDYLEAIPISRPIPDLLWVDSSPYIRPLAELQDEWETWVAVVTNAEETKIFVVSSAVPEEVEKIGGGVKNEVKVGGWSQKRYHRRRAEAYTHYAREVVEVLQALSAARQFSRIVFLGSKEAMDRLEAELPEELQGKLLAKETVDLKQGGLWEEAFAHFVEGEREEERERWERIKEEALRGGRAVFGAGEVLKAAAVGRAELMVVTRDARIAGTRCRDCENLVQGKPSRCPVCKGEDVFVVDLINELVELLAKSGGEVDFVDPIEGLSAHGDVAALLRY